MKSYKLINTIIFSKPRKWYWLIKKRKVKRKIICDAYSCYEYLMNYNTYFNNLYFEHNKVIEDIKKKGYFETYLARTYVKHELKYNFEKGFE
jgi:hypothetical protein